MSGNITSIKTTLNIGNPSEFSFLVEFIHVELLDDPPPFGVSVGYYDGYWWRSKEGDARELLPLSDSIFTVDAKSLSVSKEELPKLYVSVSIGLRSPTLPTKILSIPFVEEIPLT